VDNQLGVVCVDIEVVSYYDDRYYTETEVDKALAAG
jgi:hypothetical protein